MYGNYLCYCIFACISSIFTYVSPVYMYMEIIISKGGGGIYNVRGELTTIILRKQVYTKVIDGLIKYGLALIYQFVFAHLQTIRLILNIPVISIMYRMVPVICILFSLKVILFIISRMYDLFIINIDAMNCMVGMKGTCLCNCLCFYLCHLVCSMSQRSIDISMYTYIFIRHVTWRSLYLTKGNSEGGGDYYYIHQWVYLTYRDFG